MEQHLHATRRILVGATLMALTFALLLCAPPSAGAADDPRGVDITVDVVETTPTSPPVTPPRTTTSRGGSVVQETLTDPADVDAALGDEPFNLGGVLYLSGLTSSVAPSFTPGNGTVTLKLTVRNASSTTIDSKARFWLENAANVRVGQVNGVQVRDLEPGETRRISVTLRDLGQWTLLHGYVTFTPPKVVEGTPLSPITRDTMVALPPLFGISVGGGAAALAGAVWWLPRRLRLAA